MSTPAGWYPDPTGRHQNRWFDGDDWTDQAADGQAVVHDPIHGGGATVAGTQQVPAASAEPSPAPPPGAPPGAPAGPLGDYTSPTAAPSGNPNKVLLIVGAVVVVLVVAVGLVVVLGGGDDDSGDAASSSSADADEDEDEDEDPSLSDLFDDMADGGDLGTDGEPADAPGDDDVSGEYPPEVIANFTNSCEAQNPPDFCGCLIDYFEAEIPFDRFVEIDQELAAGGATPQELIDAQQACV